MRASLLLGFWSTFVSGKELNPQAKWYVYYSYYHLMNCRNIFNSIQVYVTATLPYLLIGAFMVRALTLEGSSLGLKYFFEPKWELFLEAKVK